MKEIFEYFILSSMFKHYLTVQSQDQWQISCHGALRVPGKRFRAMSSGFPELCVGMSQERARPQTSIERVLRFQASGGHAG